MFSVDKTSKEIFNSFSFYLKGYRLTLFCFQINASTYLKDICIYIYKRNQF